MSNPSAVHVSSLQSHDSSNLQPFSQHSSTSSSQPENKWCRNGYGQPVQKAANNGKFTTQESTLVRQAIEHYCASKNITPAKLCTETDHKAELKGAWMEIARVLPHRTVQSIYRHGLRQLHAFKRGAWTTEEQELLYELVQKNGKKWALIQGKLCRSADSCRDKYREMAKEYIKGRWETEEVDRLLMHVQEVLKLPATVAPFPPGRMSDLLCEEQDGAEGGTAEGPSSADALTSSKQAKGYASRLIQYFLTTVKSINQYCEENSITIPWSVVSRRMANRSRLSCFKKWQKMTAWDMSDVEDDDDDVDDDDDDGEDDDDEGDGEQQPHAQPQKQQQQRQQHQVHTTGKKTKKRIGATSSRTGKRKEPGDVPIAADSSTTDRLALTKKSSKRHAPVSIPTNDNAEFAVQESVEATREGTTASSSLIEPSPIIPPLAPRQITAVQQIPQKDCSSVKKAKIEPLAVATTLDRDIPAKAFALTDKADIQLLHQLSATEALRPTDIAWATGLSHPRAYARYQEILDMAERANDADEVLDMPLAAQARVLLQRAGLVREI